MTSNDARIQQLIEKAWSDPEFKQLLLANPKAAIKDLLDIDVPEDVEITVVEETANKYYLVIPQQPSLDHSQNSTWA